jgi:xanthosine utilization system XapX-like protein
MYLLLLVFGAVLGVAGIVFVGLSLRDGTFVAVLTPGIVAVVGGFLMVGLGFGLRTLQRIEQALASRSTPGAWFSGETADAVKTGDVPRQTALLPSPPKISRSPQRAAAPSVPRLGNDSCDPERQPPDSASAADKMTPSLPPIAISAAHEGNADTDPQRAGKQGNATAATRSAERLRMSMRSGTPTERQKQPTFDSLWPKGPRPVPSTPPASKQAVAVSAAEEEEAAAAMPVSVLKSGVINGMAYTLYSDGSIETQLPEGTLRFGSINELRNHIEQSTWS